MIHIDAEADTLDVALSDEELARRRAAYQAPPQARLAGALEKYAALVRPACLGAVTHSGQVDWPYETPEAE